MDVHVGWHQAKEGRKGMGFMGFPHLHPNTERSQREGRKRERADMAKELEEALAVAKTCIGLKRLLPKGNQTPRAGEPPLPY